MKKMFEALYNERRNAIPSWQGYHYQGMIAIVRFLEGLVEKFKCDTSENKAKGLKLKIEWIEDFILFENDTPKEIYQIKKTLTNSERKEVLYNFIIFCFTGKSEDALTEFKMTTDKENINKKLDVSNRFSTGQKNVVNIALMLALKKIQTTNLNVFMIDDPCQSLDELNIASFVEIIKNEFTKTQIILSTHEDKYLKNCYSLVSR